MSFFLASHSMQTGRISANIPVTAGRMYILPASPHSRSISLYRLAASLDFQSGKAQKKACTTQKIICGCTCSFALYITARPYQVRLLSDICPYFLRVSLILHISRKDAPLSWPKLPPITSTWSSGEYPSDSNMSGTLFMNSSCDSGRCEKYGLIP